jgi:MoaA/NifB/PqqE/SkfB family radical SAM enzyme
MRHLDLEGARERGAQRRQMRQRIKEYLSDPFLRRLYEEAMNAGRFVPITLDLTHVCQLRCEGCYFFSEQLDNSKAPRDEAVFDAFVEQERARGTNFITVIGGEPSLQLPRLKKLHDNFRCVTVTNGLRRIPMEGFERMALAVSVWGDHELDKELRGAGKIDVFARALRHYRDDPRAAFYFTVSNGNAEGVDSAVDEIVANGNLVAFSFYEDWAGLGGEFDQSKGYARALREVYRMIDKYPDRILTTAYSANIASGRTMFDLVWGHETCPVVSSGYDPDVDGWHGSDYWREQNAKRLRNGQPYYPNHRSVMPDLKSVRRCSVGEESDCSKCHNAYARYIWIMLNRNIHTDTKQDFTNWLTTAWMFSFAAGALDRDQGMRDLPEIHERTRAARRADLEPDAERGHTAAVT